VSGPGKAIGDIAGFLLRYGVGFSCVLGVPSLLGLCSEVGELSWLEGPVGLAEAHSGGGVDAGDAEVGQFGCVAGLFPDEGVFKESGDRGWGQRVVPDGPCEGGAVGALFPAGGLRPFGVACEAEGSEAVESEPGGSGDTLLGGFAVADEVGVAGGVVVEVGSGVSVDAGPGGECAVEVGGVMSAVAGGAGPVVGQGHPSCAAEQGCRGGVPRRLVRLRCDGLLFVSFVFGRGDAELVDQGGEPAGCGITGLAFGVGVGAQPLEGEVDRHA